MTPLVVLAVVVYALASGLLFLFGLNLCRLSIVAWRRGLVPSRRPVDPDQPLRSVTVQLPLYNEPAVARRLIEACAALTYPRSLLQIQVLDDSDDGSSDEIGELVADLAAAGLSIEHHRRRHRAGYKAGALGAALDHATGELIAVFDADFVPPADFLTALVGEFDQPDVAFVQARWGHLNRRQSWLTRLQAPAIDGHFLVEQQARGHQGHWFNFNGTAGIWRRAAIDDAGGWRADTLTEDLDLSYRAHLRGWRGVYRPDVVAPAELPNDLRAFRRQQHRWARGSLECAGKLLGSVWAAPVATGVKVQATFHLTAYGVHVLLVLMVVTYPALVLATTGADLPRLWWLATLGPNLMSVAPLLFLVTGQRVQGRRSPRLLPALGATLVVGSGLMVNSTRAALSIVFRPDPEFERTTKSGSADAHSARTFGDVDPRVETAARCRGQAQPTRPRLDRIVVAEAGLGVYALATTVLAVDRGSWGVAFYATLFGTGLLVLSGATVLASLPRPRPRSRTGSDPVPARPSVTP